jgi:hypothetical protein
VSGNAGEIVEVKVDLLNNPGIMALGFEISYDNNKLKLLEVEDCKLFEGLDSTFGKDMGELPYKVIWDSVDGNAKNNGTVVIFRFEIIEGTVVSEIEIEVKLDKSSTFNVDMDEVDFSVVNGKVSVIS